MKMDLAQPESVELAVNPHVPDLESIREFERFVMKFPQVQLETSSILHGGMCARTIMIPAGLVCTGALVKIESIAIMNGDITMITDDGPKRFTGWHVFAANSGIKRVGVTHQDTYWTTVFKTDAESVAQAEDDFTSESEMLQTRRSQLQFDAADDFDEMLNQIGVTKEFVRAESERTDNMIDLPAGVYKIDVRESAIEGKGLFATSDIQAGEVIAPARIGDKRTIAGRYTNHSKKPNAKPVRNGDTGIDLIADSFICGGNGGVDGDEITVDYRESLRLAIQINMEKSK
jgi:hypothetical protein